MFGCVEWQSQLFRGSLSARCFPFDMPKKRVTWATFQLRILQGGSKLTGMKATVVQLRLGGGARQIEPDSK